ncbi:MAG: ABC transporter substrate-binding protein [Sphaerochaetaceae bacterium]|nr:ABC transporter substrate-binding protein [Sphaerochaetaceae bacterium]
MKRLTTVALLMILSICVFASAVTESKAQERGLINVNVGTTAVIEKAVQGEYNYDMLSSGVSQIPLVRQDGNGTFHPLAASFSTADAKTWTYTVTEGLTWSDGVPVTAEDILFTLVYEDANGSANLVSQTSSDGKVTQAKYSSYEISADHRSISLTLGSANVRELTNMTSFRIIPEHLYSDGEVTEADARVSCGPFVLESFDPASGTITFGVNTYYPSKPAVDKVVYHLFGNEDTMYMALMNGDIDFTFIYSSGTGADYLEVLEKNENVSVLSYSASNAPCVLAFNNTGSVFSDENLRKAISFALDYEKIVSYAGGSSAKVANTGFVPESTVGYRETEKLATDLEKAASYMEKAGYTKNEAGKFVDKDGKEFSFSLTYRLDKSQQVTAAELVKTSLEAFGINVVLDGLDSASYNAKTSNKFSNNNVSFEASLFGFTSAGMSMMNGLGTIYVDKNHAVQGGCQVTDPQFKSALEKMAGAQSIEEYYEGASDMQDFYSQKTPLIALYWSSMNFAVSSRFTGYQIDNVFGLNNVETWFNLKENHR